MGIQPWTSQTWSPFLWNFQSGLRWVVEKTVHQDNFRDLRILYKYNRIENNQYGAAVDGVVRGVKEAPWVVGLNGERSWP